MKSDQDESFLQQCIALAIESAGSGGGPFGALVVRDGQVLAKAANRVTLNFDPTAHAEIEAIRNATHTLGTPHLADCVLYASCEPCPMCLAAALWARIPHVIFAATHAEADRAGFADTFIANQLYGQPQPKALRPSFMQHFPVANASAPLDAWLANQDRVKY